VGFKAIENKIESRINNTV